MPAASAVPAPPPATVDVGALGAAPYRVRSVATPGVLIGHVTGGSPIDTSIVPTHDVQVCRPFTESLLPSRAGGVGQAVVWLEGVESGPPNDAPRRVRLTLDRCRLEPRVQRIAVGGTVMISGRDAMRSRLQLLPEGTEGPSRATIFLSDVGQMVPSSDAARLPGLIHVRDDLHPWIHAWIAVAPHPFVAVTGADGTFRFDVLPPGRYTLVVWHERLGLRRTPVRIDGHVETKVEVRF